MFRRNNEIRPIDSILNKDGEDIILRRVTPEGETVELPVELVPDLDSNGRIIGISAIPKTPR